MFRTASPPWFSQVFQLSIREIFSPGRRAQPQRPPQREDDFSIARGLTNPNHWPRRIVLICGKLDPCWREANGWLSDIGAVMMAVEDRDIPLEWFKLYSKSFDTIVIDCEHIGDLNQVMDLALELRHVSPDVPLILASRNFRAHDFSATRQPVADASLRLPMSRSAFFLGVGAAIDNLRRKTTGAHESAAPE